MRRAAALAIVLAASAPACAADGQPSQQVLADMGLAGIEFMTDDEASAVRGSGFSGFENLQQRIVDFHDRIDAFHERVADFQDRIDDHVFAGKDGFKKSKKDFHKRVKKFHHKVKKLRHPKHPKMGDGRMKHPKPGHGGMGHGGMGHGGKPII